MAGRKYPPLRQRVWSRVPAKGSNDCWEWSGYRNEHGYGALKGRLAHRLVWQLERGPIPDGMNVCHRCDNPPCCNPAHLFLGTQSDNVHDMVSKGRRRGGNVAGERNGASKLTDADVASIRERYVPRKVTLRQLATEYGVSDSAISMIVNGRRWPKRGGGWREERFS